MFVYKYVYTTSKKITNFFFFLNVHFVKKKTLQVEELARTQWCRMTPKIQMQYIIIVFLGKVFSNEEVIAWKGDFYQDYLKF